MMVKVLLLAALATFVVAAEYSGNFQKCPVYGPFEIIDMPKLWNMYKTTYNKNYSGVEDQMRYGLFEKAVKSVVESNLKSIANMSMELSAINVFSDCTPEEYQSWLQNGRLN
ncbi:uncharacterized protein LOC109542377 [Dendroctonus ponderosae]|uniref:Cathepsin propeptide inhibitor domain-containing protein n=1 Tax=Dendroctonus ponderosae TaxID=77166 RepID=A0AAR5Q1N8_DENPD|nr:uncharacterized protein LOC109542377 [Dendroctonus ponderosae]KAH1001647.1 hypothetical protein HUJ04_005635 [Dendroctonus ponderosae]KAH1004623.1 hypothetical protein HUJ05_005415 [Dendroctonus ponderosae]